MEKTNDVLKFAKQGNAKAIEAIFSKQLSASNIAVKAVVRNGCLQIMFEAKQALSQVTMVNGVKKVLTSINPENIQTVKVYSKQTGDDFPKWHEEFELAEKKKVDISPNIDLVQPEAQKLSKTDPASDINESPSQAKNSAIESPQLIDTNAKSHINDLTNNLTSPNIADEDSSLMEKARWGYLDSISTLLNSAFNGQGVSASLNKPRVKLLEIVLKSNGIIDKQIAIEIICRILNKTKTRVFNEVSISVDTSESNFLSWNQNLIFKDNQFIADDDSLLMEKARLGYLDSISTLLNSAFTAFTGQGISASLNKPRANFLEIVLKSNGIIDKQVAIEIICRILNKTETRFFNAISVSVDTSESNFPSWNQNLIFKDNQFVVSSSDSDVFSHLAKFVIEAMDNIGTRIREIYKTSDVYQSTSFSQNTENKKSHSNLIPIVVVGGILLGLFQLYQQQNTSENSLVKTTSSTTTSEITPDQKAESFLTLYLEEVLKGNSGSTYFCDGSNVTSFFAPRSYKILSASAKGISKVRIDSSTAGGIQVTNNWTFILENNGIGQYGFCIQLIVQSS